MFKSYKRSIAVYVRNFIFGAEDSLVSTVGLLAGVTVAGMEKQYIITAGIVLIFVEALSMGVGSFLSEKSLEEYKKVQNSRAYSLPGSVIMFFSYLFFGFIPLFPYLGLVPETALKISIAATFIALFLLGAISAKILKTAPLRNGLRMLFLGGGATVLGIFVGIALR